MITPPRVSPSQAGADLSFALAVTPVELREGRKEVLREVQHWLTVWERTQDEQAHGRFLEALYILGLMGGGRP